MLTPKRTKNAKAARAAAINLVMIGGMPRTLGVRVVSLSRKKVIGEMRIKPRHLNHTGKVNGGAMMAFADVLGAVGAVTNRPPGYRGGTIESKTNFFAAGTGPVLRAVTIPLHIGRTTSVWQTTIRNPDRRVVAIVTQTQIMLPGKEEWRPACRGKIIAGSPEELAVKLRHDIPKYQKLMAAAGIRPQ